MVGSTAVFISISVTEFGAQHIEGKWLIIKTACRLQINNYKIYL